MAELSIQDLTDVANHALTTADFQAPAPDAPINDRSASQVAAGEAIVQGNTTTQNYRQIKEILLSPEARQQFILDQQARRDAITADMKNAVGPTLINPNIPDGQKKAMVTALQDPNTKYQSGTVRQLFEQGVGTSAPNETEASHAAKLNLTDMIGDVENQKRQATAAINSLQLGKDQNLGTKLKDMGELLVPFAEWVHTTQIANQALGGKAAILMGNQKAQLFKLIQQYPVNERAKITAGLIGLIKDNPNVVLPDGNDLESLDLLNKMLVNNDYSNGQKWFDNISNLLDIGGVVGLIGKAGKLVKGAEVAQEASKAGETASEGAKSGKLYTTYKDENGNVHQAEILTPDQTPSAAEAAARSVHTDVVPTSPSQVMKDANPETAQAMHDRTAADPTDETAMALYGTTRNEALAKDVLPEPQVKDGTIPNKPIMEAPGPQFPENAAVKDIRTTDGQTYFSEAEKAAARDRLTQGLQSVEGIIPHPNSMGIKLNDDGSTTFSMMFHPATSGFTDPQTAIDNAVHAFRAYGMTPEDFTLYARKGDQWVETTPKELAAQAIVRDKLTKAGKNIPAELKNVDYAVGLKYNWKMKPEDLQIQDALSVKRNVFDMLPPGPLARHEHGSFTQHILDAASVLHPQIVEPASVAVDRSTALKKAYINTFETFTKNYKSLPRDRQVAMTEYIHEANQEGLPFNEVDLRARGFNDKEIETLKHWRMANDTMWYSANADMVKTLRNRGYQVFVDKANDTQLVARPLTEKAVSEGTSVYDSAENAIKQLSKEDLQNLYAKGGSYAQLSEPIQVGNKWIDKILVPANSTSSYIRAMRDDEKVLRYRDGYYPKMYDANFYIQKEIRTVDGAISRKTIASAKHKADADHLYKNLIEQNPDSVFHIEPDRRNAAEHASTFDRMGWDVGVNSGLSMQRVRGEQLMDASADMEKSSYSNLVDPLQAVGRQIQQLAARTSLRDYMDATKNRWMQQYGDKLDIPNHYGKKVFPANITQIKPLPGTSMKTLADARSMFNYLHHLENGYINSIDEGYKALMQWFGDAVAGDSQVSKLAEGFLRDASKARGTSQLKGAVFRMFLASNPIRQFIIQGHQNVQLMAIAPKYFTMPNGLAHDMWRLTRVWFGDKSDAEAVQMYNELVKSGMMEAVDSNNLVRQSMITLADTTTASRVKHAIGAPMRAAQRIGFDTAEQSVLIESWLTHRYLALQAGKELTRQTYDEIAGKARAFTYNMNRAGDQPYNQNSLNIMFQFMQVPQKAFLQPLTNRSLNRADRAKLLAFNTIMYGVPTGIVGGLVTDIMGDNQTSQQVHDAITSGFEDVLLNQILTQASGVPQQIDFGSSLAPANITGMGQFISSLATLNVGTILSNTPSASLFFGANPRLTQAFRTISRYFNAPWDADYKDPALQTRLSDVVLAAADMYSGFSNAFKARYAFKTGKALSSLGNVTDAEVTKIEAAFMLAGFTTKTQTGGRLVKQQQFNDAGGSSSYATKASDVKLWYNELKRQLARRGTTVKDDDISLRILSEGWRVFQDDPYGAREQLKKAIQADVKKGDYDLFKSIMNKVKIKSVPEVRQMLNLMPPSPTRDKLNEQLDNLEKAQQHG